MKNIYITRAEYDERLLLQKDLRGVLTEELVKKELLRQLICDIPLEELEKIFKIEKEHLDNRPIIRYSASINI